jgi:hypothetical protein
MTKTSLYIVCCPGGYYPYVRIGWCVRVDGFIEIYNCRVIKRFGTDAELARIAVEGPKPNTKLLSMVKMEGTSTGIISRYIECDPTKWEKECPKPDTIS